MTKKPYISLDDEISPKNKEVNGTRSSLVLKPAKLITKAGEIPCMLREVNGRMLKVTILQPLLSRKIEFELPNGLRSPAIVSSVTADSAVLLLDSPFDQTALRANFNNLTNRQMRLNVRINALLHVRETSAQIIVKNISRSGARIESNIWLRLEKTISIEARFLPKLYAWVKWRHHPDYGVTFEQTFSLNDIARICAQNSAPLETSARNSKRLS